MKKFCRAATIVQMLRAGLASRVATVGGPNSSTYQTFSDLLHRGRVSEGWNDVNACEARSPTRLLERAVRIVALRYEDTCRGRKLLKKSTLPKNRPSPSHLGAQREVGSDGTRVMVLHTVKNEVPTKTSSVTQGRSHRLEKRGDNCPGKKTPNATTN